MATTNPFDLLGDDDNDDVNQLIQKLPPPQKSPAPPQAAAAQPAKQAKLPSKPLPPAQSVREARSEAPRGDRGRGRGFGRGRGRGGFDRDSGRGGFDRDSVRGGFDRDSGRGGFDRDSGRGGFDRDSGRGGFDRDSVNNENPFGNSNGYSKGYRPLEEGDAGKSSEKRGYDRPRGGYRGGRRGGFSNGEVVEGERPRRAFERHSGTGRGNEIKREGAGRGNWGTPTDEISPETEEPVNENEKTVDAEKQLGKEDAEDANKENPVNEPEEKEPEEKEMTLEEYEKVLEEKRKALSALKAEERKVDLDKEFESMQLLSSKKSDDEIFVKLGSEKDKRREAAEKEERAKKSVSINEFLKPAEGERYYSPGGRGRGRGRGPRGGGFSGRNMVNNVAAPSIEDVGQFPSLGAK
ncbi:RGG repeats nuclear RNA binding protein A-like [Cornus florida]|uniref:RGG repeats nuclear RNA binding protein A-like n=1 Tax=Cornus florida TaxID=4283 RepID=UPI0028A0230F|nr:RGG repeats nuclear RNA binding protein A-like [Cornus florida]